MRIFQMLTGLVLLLAGALLTAAQAQSACTIYNSTNIPVVLPNQVASINSSLVATSAGLISDLNVTVDMAHSWPGDLTMTLSNQQTNTSVVILDKPGVPSNQWGCQNSDILATFDDDGTLDSETTCASTPPAIGGNFQPSSPLSAFSQEQAAGTWVLQIDDAYVSADSGTLNAWSIEICSESAGNQAPVLTDPGAQTNQINDVVNFALVASDVDVGDSLTYTASGLPSGLTIDTNSGLISGTVDTVGVSNVTLTVSDGNGGSHSLSVEWTVQAQNACTIYNSTNIPVALPNQVASINSSLVATSTGLISDLNVTVDMAHSWPGDLTMTLSNQQTNTSVVILDKPGVPSNQWGCQNSDIQAMFDDDGTLDSETTCAATPPAIGGNFQSSSSLSAFNQEQAASSWMLRIDDAYVTADPGTLNAWSIEICTESAGNQAPIANAGEDFSVYVGQSLSLPGTVLDDGVTLPLSIAWTSINGITYADDSDPATTATFDSVGQFSLLLSADDTEFFVDDTVVVTVSLPINQPPVVDAGVNFTAQVGVPIQLAGSVEDDGLDLPLAINWAGLSGVSYVDSFDPATTVTFDTPGTYLLELSASDPEFVASDTVVVNVVENSPRIMPLGDSITHGYGYWSYRHRLSDMLLAQQCIFDFVGSENGPGSGPGGRGCL